MGASASLAPIHSPSHRDRRGSNCDHARRTSPGGLCFRPAPNDLGSGYPGEKAADPSYPARRAAGPNCPGSMAAGPHDPGSRSPPPTDLSSQAPVSDAPALRRRACGCDDGAPGDGDAGASSRTDDNASGPACVRRHPLAQPSDEAIGLRTRPPGAALDGIGQARRQRRGFEAVQSRGGLVKMILGGGLGAEHSRPPFDDIEVHLHDPVLRPDDGHEIGQRRLGDLAHVAPPRPEEQVLRRLHGDGARASQLAAVLGAPHASLTALQSTPQCLQNCASSETTTATMSSGDNSVQRPPLVRDLLSREGLLQHERRNRRVDVAVQQQSVEMARPQRRPRSQPGALRGFQRRGTFVSTGVLISGGAAAGASDPLRGAAFRSRRCSQCSRKALILATQNSLSPPRK